MVPRRDHATVAFTFDLHDVDHPSDVRHAAEWFAERGLPATFFVPSALFAIAPLAEALRRLPALGHEVASHGHEHDWNEIDALMGGRPERLGFLRESHARHADFFGEAPASFRSPRWCTLGPHAVHALAALGYRADSSATPQRFPLFSSTPLNPGWWASPRTVHELAPGLLEIPTSTLLVPAGAPAFLTLRGAGSRTLVAALMRECRWSGAPLVLQFHVEDFTPATLRDRGWGRASWRDLLPRARGGFRIKLFLRERDPDRIVATHRGVVEACAPLEPSTIGGIARARYERRPSGRTTAAQGA
ncbi:MAG: polysaccharide deacetylase family protein [Candidatus Eisenbacteria bacterium]|uniref:Polysaccharide deacetylase family protein n=1 Tax=Eiseniibacteriota bacterium TaxID=2212470 RepID=A0A933W2Y4_UNCEI|nr:polysaccharide deacetylase family protein [Candidatus Eisenbacteria bacterium]